MGTLLQGVNRVLTRVNVISSKNALDSLTDSANQTFIDTAIDNWNEAIEELFELSPIPRPKAIKTSTLTLAATREYSLHSNLTKFRFDYHLIDETNNHIITTMTDAHKDMVFGDIEQDDTGLPHFATINPETGRMLMDRTPDTDDLGKVYKYRYERDLELDSADDEFPFRDAVMRALVPAVAELWKFEHKKSGSADEYNRAMAKAAKRLREAPARSSYGPTRRMTDQLDPFNAAAVR